MTDSKQFRFRKHVTIGALAAEQDSVFLRSCFVDTGLLDAVKDPKDHRRVILGRTGAGKSALFATLQERAETIIIKPEELAVYHLNNSELLRQLRDCGISLLPLYKLLWKHVFVTEVLRARHEQLRDADAAPGFWRNLLNSFSSSARHQTYKDALEYLAGYGHSFWHTTDYRIREVTEKIESQLKATLGAKLGAVTLSASGSQDASAELKSAVEHIGREFVKAIQIKKLAEVVNWLADDIAGRAPLFIVIDGLDEEWAEATLRYDLIRALIDTSREFAGILNLKVLIALREDLFESVLAHATDVGFQREKYLQLCHNVKWTRDELRSLIDSRVNKLVREAYTSAQVRLDDLMEPIERVPGIQYIIDRTLLRPRDAINFFNRCLLQATDNTRITQQMVLAAEPFYSKDRLDAIVDEWRAVEPLVGQVAALLRGLKATFRLRDVSDTLVAEFCLKLYVGHSHMNSPCVAIAKQHSEQPALMTALQVKQHFFKMLYKVGIIGVKPEAAEKRLWSHDGPPTVDDHELGENCSISIQKAFWRALAVVVSNRTG